MAANGVVCSQVDDLCVSLTRNLNCLRDDSRQTRVRALEAIRKEVLPPGSQNDVVHAVIGPLVHVFSDPVEKCRELSIVTVTELVRSVSEPSELLQYVVPSLVQRLGQPDIVESSEELRLKLVVLVTVFIDLTTSQTAPYLDDFVRILQRTIIDPYPEVKKESCSSVSKLAQAIPQYFHMQSESLIKPLIITVSHQHSRVRVAAVKAIGDVIQYGNGKSVDDVVSHLAQRLFDSTPAVRAAVTQVVGKWLLDLLDRYSFHHKLIPLLLTSLMDEMPEIKNQAEGLWHDVGLKYADENEKDFKDKMDFARPDPEHYPQGVDRPNLGCRMLMYQNFSKILSGLINDLGDWVVGTRIKSSQLLYVLLLNEEDNVTQHLEKVLGGLYKAINDDEQTVVEYVLKSAELLGYFVKPDVIYKLLLQNVKMSQSAGSVAVLAAVIRGSPKSLLVPHLTDITSTITDPGICHIAESGLHNALLDCVQALIDVVGSDCDTISLALFNIIICVMALHRVDGIKIRANSLITLLGKVQSFGDNGSVELFRRHMQPVLHSMKPTCHSWTQHSLERVVFDTLLVESGTVVGTVLEDVIPMLAANLSIDKDVEVRNKFFVLLSRLLLDAENTVNSEKRFGEFIVIVVHEMILPNCVWRAGRTAAAIRKAAIACLWALVKSCLLTQDKLMEVMEDLLTQLRSTLEDDSKDTRLISCRVLLHLFTAVGRLLDQDRLHNIYPDLLKRLDDSSDDIRIAATQTFSAYFNCFEDKYDAILYRAHIEAIYSGLLIHLDDPDRSIQQAVAETLKQAAGIAPDLLLKLIDVVKHKHRSTAYCDHLTEFIHLLPKPDSSMS